MFSLYTSQKIFIASILSKILIFFLGKGKKIISRNNINYQIDLNEGIDLGVFLNIKNEKRMFNLSRILDVRSNLNFIDIGSNIGSVTLPLCQLFKSSKIYAIEPTYYAYKKLLKNISLNLKLKKRIVPLNYLISKNLAPKMVHSSWSLDRKDNKHKIHLGSLKKINKKK